MKQGLKILLAMSLTAVTLVRAQEHLPQSKTVPDSINFIWKSIAKDFTRLADAMPEENEISNRRRVRWQTLAHSPNRSSTWLAPTKHGPRRS